MEWLIAHEDDLNSEPATKEAAPKAAKTEISAVSPANKPNDSINNDGQVEEGSAAKMAATKKITVEEAQRIITERMAKRTEEERIKQIEDEKRRRLDGQKMAETRAELQDQERIRLAQQIRREKLEKEMHRKQVLEQIARDREAMRLKNSQTASPSTTSSNSSSLPSTTSASSKPKAPVTECKIALRFPDGSSLIHKFSPQEQLAAVRLFVQMEKGGSSGIEFIAPPNRKLTETQMEETLESLGLCPASRLEVKYKQAVLADLD